MNEMIEKSYAKVNIFLKFQIKEMVITNLYLGL